jgi:uncharacterized paraquat-inducible protein A
MPRPLRPPESRTQSELAHQLQRNIETVLMNGFYFCDDCDCMCERMEGEQGQPAHCSRCGGHRINWNPPVDQVLQPEAA